MPELIDAVPDPYVVPNSNSVPDDPIVDSNPIVIQHDPCAALHDYYEDGFRIPRTARDIILRKYPQQAGWSSQPYGDASPSFEKMRTRLERLRPELNKQVERNQELGLRHHLAPLYRSDDGLVRPRLHTTDSPAFAHTEEQRWNDFIQHLQQVNAQQIECNKAMRQDVRFNFEDEEERQMFHEMVRVMTDPVQLRDVPPRAGRQQQRNNNMMTYREHRREQNGGRITKNDLYTTDSNKIKRLNQRYKEALNENNNLGLEHNFVMNHIITTLGLRDANLSEPRISMDDTLQFASVEIQRWTTFINLLNHANKHRKTKNKQYANEPPVPSRSETIHEPNT